jgi:hypothetical protein
MHKQVHDAKTGEIVKGRASKALIAAGEAANEDGHVAAIRSGAWWVPAPSWVSEAETTTVWVSK